MQKQLDANPFHLHKPRPRFCIVRPDGLQAPLIPLDELPSWLEIYEWGTEMFKEMRPVSLSAIPRDGEYDVICHHCSNSVDEFHLSASLSASERSDVSPQSPVSQTQSCPPGFFNPKGRKPLEAGPLLPAPEQSPFNVTLQSPFGGVLTLDVHGIATNRPFLSDAFQKQLSPPSGSPSMSDPSPDESPHSLRESPEIKPSLQPSLPDTDSRCNLASAMGSAVAKGKENQPAAQPPKVASSPVVEDADEVAAMISSAIAASLCGKSVRSVKSVKSAASIKSADESVASARSLTALVQRYEQVRQDRAPPRRTPRACSIPESVISKISIESGRSKGSPIHKAHNAASRRHAKIRRRRRRADKAKVSRPSSTVSSRKPKPEQMNSATKRRDRREKLVRGRKDKEANDQYWHMETNWRTQAARR